MDLIVEELVKKHWKKISKKKNVIGYSGHLLPKIVAGKVYPSRKAFRIYVSKKMKVKDLHPRDIIPMKLNASNGIYETDIIEIGEIKALDNKEKRRPVCAGISTMHYGMEGDTACTITGFFRDNETKEILIASNNHCYSRENKAKIGDPVVQPGPYDGGTDKDIIGHLFKYVPVKFNPFTCPVRNILVKIKRFFTREDTSNKVDIAFATIEVPYEVIATYIGPFKGKTTFKIGDQVTKTGRTTEQTYGKVIDIDYNGRVQYSRGIAWFTDCYLIQGHHFSQGGDSGSPVFDMNGNYGGALFAGSDEFTIVCKVENIEEIGDVELVTSDQIHKEEHS